MKTTVEELKELYTSMGGTAHDVAGVSTIPDMLAALAEIAGTTIELPAVSSTDNGDVLTVVSGKWAKADLPKELPESATSGQVLTYNGSAWGAANVPTNIETVNALSSGQFTSLTSPASTISLDGWDNSKNDALFAAAEAGKLIVANVIEKMSETGRQFHGKMLLEYTGDNLIGTLGYSDMSHIYILRLFFQKNTAASAVYSRATVSLSS